jgi:hypothetical protein
VLIANHDGIAEETHRSQLARHIVGPRAPHALRNAWHAIISGSKTVARARKDPKEITLRAVSDHFEFAIERAFLEPIA